MPMSINKNFIILLLIAGIAVVGVSGYTIYKQASETRCETCGMLVTPEIKQHIDIVDGSGTPHYACCQACMLRLLDPNKGYSTLHIETYCDYYGPDYKITIDCTQNGNNTVTTPNTAVILLGGKIVASCANNRIAYNTTASDRLIADGYSAYTMSWQRSPLPQGTPIIPVAMVAKTMAQKGISYTPPSLTAPLLLGGFGVFVLIVSGFTLRKYE